VAFLQRFADSTGLNAQSDVRRQQRTLAAEELAGWSTRRLSYPPMTNYARLESNQQPAD
jgi:hypothetical protein